MKTRPWRRRLAWASVALLAAFAVCTVAANFFIRMSAGPFLRQSIPEVAAPIAIVPGASVHRDGTPSPQLSERLSAALTLMRAGRVQKVLVSGARNGAYDEAGPMRRWLTQRGINGALVIEDHAGFRTLDTMKRAARVYAVGQAVICTQNFHLPRAVFLARRAGIDALGFAADAGTPGRPTLNALRESLANLIAVIDVLVLDRQPRELGPSPHQSPAPKLKDSGA